MLGSQEEGIQWKDKETEAQRGAEAYWESAESGLEQGLPAPRQGMCLGTCHLAGTALILSKGQQTQQLDQG